MLKEIKEINIKVFINKTNRIHHNSIKTAADKVYIYHEYYMVLKDNVPICVGMEQSDTINDTKKSAEWDSINIIHPDPIMYEF